MNCLESQIEKHLVSFCELLPSFVASWESALQETTKPIQTLRNLTEQRRHICKGKTKHLDHFKDVQATLLFQIQNRIEEEIINLKPIIGKLNKINNDLKNKLLAFEKSTLDLAWNQTSEIITGNGSRPSLKKVLQNSFNFLNFFCENAKNINDNFRDFDVEDQQSFENFQTAFDINFNVDDVNILIALTQYVNNTKAIK